jgi:hypothetical protein
VALLLIAVLGAPVGTSAAQEEPPGGIGLRLLDAPVAAKDDPRARIYIVDHLAPGSVIERRIEVSNSSAEAHDVVLYAAAASIGDGTFVGAAGDTPNDLSTWTSISPQGVTVAAGGTGSAVVTIAVPDGAAPGEQYGVVWAEVRSAPDAGGGVVQVSRVGIRLYVSVGPGGAPAADFTLESLTAERSAGGAPVVTADVRNTGGRALDMKGTLELANGPGGLTAGPFEAELGGTLAVDGTLPVRIELDDRLPDGPWDAVVTLGSGLTERSASATLTFPKAGAAAPVDADETDAGAPSPLIIASAAGGVVALGAGGWTVRRRLGGRRAVAAAGPA